MSEIILLVDDEPNILKVLGVVLEREGYRVERAGAAEEALAIVANKTVDALVTDLMMPGMDGLELLQRVREQDPALPVILMTAHGTIETAVEAMKRGAYDYLTKPIDNTALVAILDKALNTRSLRDADVSVAEVGPGAKPSRSAFLGESESTRELIDSVQRVAKVDSTVLLVGETGTGKELIARMLHSEGPRVKGAFQAVNCAALPGSLIESELFGYEKGAFTGANQEKPGRFELADGGTIFLDEIGEMPLDLQPKLLRVLQERCFERVGGVKLREVDIRVVAATNRDLRELTAAGEFREDLYYRLNVITLRLAPLRERREDIPLLVAHFCEKLAKRLGQPQRRFEDDAIETLMRHDWPGNVRELENLVERMTVLEPAGTVGPTAVARELEMAVRPLPTSASSIKDQVGATSGALEIQMIRKALKENKDNRTHAAAQLGISRRTLQLKMKRYGLQDRGVESSGQ